MDICTRQRLLVVVALSCAQLLLQSCSRGCSTQVEIGLANEKLESVVAAISSTLKDVGFSTLKDLGFTDRPPPKSGQLFESWGIPRLAFGASIESTLGTQIVKVNFEAIRVPREERELTNEERRKLYRDFVVQLQAKLGLDNVRADTRDNCGKPML